MKMPWELAGNPRQNEVASDEQAAVYHNQTAILSWLRSCGHLVNFARDKAVPSIHLPPRRLFSGKPCPYCGEPMTGGRNRPTKDHRTPRSKGGQLTAENRLIVCYQCNSDKGGLTVEQWYERLHNGGDPRALRVR